MQNARSFIRWSIVAFSVILALAWAPAALAAAPSIGSLSPGMAVAGSAAFTLTITGTNFTAASNATWGTTALATTYESEAELTAYVPDTLAASADAICVTVSTDGDTSFCAIFTINPPPATILGLSPASAVAPGVAHTIHPFASPPAVTGVTPATGSTGGAVLTPPISGTNPSSSASPLTASSSSAPLPSTNSNLSSDSLTTTFVGASKPAFAFFVNPPPTITSLSPTTAVAGGAAFTLTINGTNFTSTSTSSWGATALATTYVSATQLTATVPASLIASAGTASVTVSNVDGSSAGAAFTVNPPPPTIASLSPTSMVATGATFTLTINGTNFLPGAGVTVGRWNYTALTTTYVSSTQLTAAVPASLIAYPGTASISVVTAGGTSSGVSFTVNPAPPIITVMGMTRVPAGFGAFTLNIYGTNFTSPMVANFGATPLTATLVGGITLPVTIPASLVANVGALRVSVTAAGGTSALHWFTITQPSPTITSVSPATVAAGGAAFTLTINGTNFTSASTSAWGATALATTYVSATQLTAAVPASLIATAGTAYVQVYVSGGPGYSNSAIITINPAPPTISSLSPSSGTAGGAGFMLTITGNVFTTASAVMWGTTPLDTVYVSPTQLSASVPASLIQFSGTGSITVTTAAGTSAPATFTINPALPAISGLTPGVTTAGSAGFTLTINGAYFTSATTSKWGSTALTTAYVSSTQLTAAVPASLIASAGTVSVTVTTAVGTSPLAAFTIYPAPRITTTTLPSGTAGNAYSGPINVTGGAPGYTWTVTGLPNSLSYFNSSDSTLIITGTPLSTGAITFQASVQDTVGSTAGPVTLTINVAAGPSAANDSSLNGSYACLLQGSIDDDGSRSATVASFQADGQGNFSSGVFDTNSYDIGSASGIMTGRYSIGSDMNGLASTHTILTNNAAGIQTLHWAIALASAAQPAQNFRMVETDDLGALPSGQQATVNCYLATASAFAASTISGSSFVFGLDGENNSSNLKATVGLFSASGGQITGGNLDTSLGGSATVQTLAFTGSYTAPDPATGRFTLALKGAGTSTGYTVYIIDASRMFILDNTSDDGEQAGNMRAQQQASTSGATVSGPFVFYLRGAEFNTGAGTPSGFYSNVFQGTGDGEGNLTINQSYTNNAGAYTAGQSNGGPTALTFDSSNPGRATFTSASNTTYLYLFNTNSAFEMSVGGNGSLDSGWLEPQTQTVFTGAALAGNYLFGELPLMNLLPTGYVGEYNLTGSGAISGATTSATQGALSWDQSLSTTYAWDAMAPGTGTFLIASGAQGAASCAVISATMFVCAAQADPSPSVQVMQK
jgi:hypothetical protein